MAAAANNGENHIRVPLTEFVREVADQAARTAAKEVLADHSTSCRVAREFNRVEIDIYGQPGNKTESPGLMGEVADLKHSRKMLTRGLRALWLVVVAITGAIAGKIWGG